MAGPGSSTSLEFQAAVDLPALARPQSQVCAESVGVYAKGEGCVHDGVRAKKEGKDLQLRHQSNGTSVEEGATESKGGFQLRVSFSRSAISLRIRRRATAFRVHKRFL